MLPIISRCKTLAAEHDPTNAAITIVLGNLIIFFVLACSFIWVALDSSADYLREGAFFRAAACLLISVPFALAYIGIHYQKARLLVPMIVSVYVLAAAVHIGSVTGFVYSTYQNYPGIWYTIAIFLLLIGANVVFFCIASIYHGVFYHTYASLKEPARVTERLNFEEAPIINKFSEEL